MTKEETRERIAIMQAYLEGKTIQFLRGVQWADLEGDPSWSNNVKYRIKKELKLRPYANAKEFLQAQKKHGPYFTYRLPDGSLSSVHRCPITIDNDKIAGTAYNLKYSTLLSDNYYWQDGTPCGILEN